MASPIHQHQGDLTEAFSITKNMKMLLLSWSAVIGLQAWHVQGATDPKVVAIVGATMFDGTGAAPHIADVIIKDDRIVAVSCDLAVPEGAQVIEAQGKAPLPGFFDLHTHRATSRGFSTTTPRIATAYLQSGVTTVNDYNQQPESYAPRREWLSHLVAPHVNFATRFSTPGGHGADWADEATTITVNTSDSASYSVDQVLKYKPGPIKVFADDLRYGTSPDNTSMDEWTLRALTAEAHKHNLKVVTEPPTPDHPFWQRPRILMTTHIGSMTRPDGGAMFVLEIIKRHQRCQPIDGLVSRISAYS
jgi:hypothetical protein